MKRVSARVVAVAAAAAVALALALPTFAASGSDDILPGVPLPPSPVVGTLDDTVAARDYDDVFAVYLDVDEKLTVEMTGGTGTDFDLQLFKPGSPSGAPGDVPPSSIVQASSTPGTSSEEFWYPASTPGTYSLDVVNFQGKGSYRLEWSIEKLPMPAIVTAAPSLVSWGGSASITGTVTLAGAPLSSAPVMIQQRTPGATVWTSLNQGTNGMPKTQTTSRGSFSYTVKPTKRTQYRAVVWPTQHSARLEGVEHTIAPRAYLSTPVTPSSVKVSRSFWVTGYLAPKHKTGGHDVTLRFYRKVGGAWKWHKTLKPANGTSIKYPARTRYSVKTTLPSKGSWKVVASIAADSIHAETTSAERTLTVR